MIPGRNVLEDRLAEVTAHYAGEEPQRPPFWGGYRLEPQAIEFWQGGVHRLHDRLLYTCTWTMNYGGWNDFPRNMRAIIANSVMVNEDRG